jgi:DNA-binding MarR family transcriptional regulator
MFLEVFMWLSWEVAEAFATPREELLVTEIAERIGMTRSKSRAGSLKKLLLSLFDDDTQARMMQPSPLRVEKALEKLERRGVVRSYIDIHTFPRQRRYTLTPR